MRNVNDLSREEAASIIRRIVDAMYLDVDQAGEHYDPEKPIAGADFIDSVATILSSYGLVPESIEPRQQPH
jgi:hypothetical protein